MLGPGIDARKEPACLLPRFIVPDCWTGGKSRQQISERVLVEVLGCHAHIHSRDCLLDWFLVHSDDGGDSVGGQEADWDGGFASLNFRR